MLSLRHSLATICIGLESVELGKNRHRCLVVRLLLWNGSSLSFIFNLCSGTSLAFFSTHNICASASAHAVLFAKKIPHQSALLGSFTEK